MRTIPLSARPALQAVVPSTRPVLRHGSRISLLAMSLMLAFPGTSYAGGAASVNGPAVAAGTGSGAGAGYDGAGNFTTVGAKNVNGTALGGSAGGGAGVANAAGASGGGIGSTQSSPGGLTSAVTGGVGGAATSTTGAGGGGDGVVLTSGGTVNVAVTGGAGGGATDAAGLSGSGGGGAGIVYTAANASLTIGSGVTGGGGGGGISRSGGGGGGGVWVTSSGAVNVTTGTVTGGKGGIAATGYSDGGGGAGVVFSATGGQLEVGGQVRGGVASGTGTGGAGVNIISGGVKVTVDSGAVIAGGAGGSASGLSAGVGVLSGLGGAGSGGAASGNRNAQTGTGGVGINAAGGGNTIVTSGAINGATGLAGQANAITFSGNNNTLELQAGYSFTGDVMAGGASNHLVLGGDTSPTASFDVSRIGAALGSNTTAYTGFSSFQKVGASTWALTGTTTKATPWTLSGGTLSVSSDGALGATSGDLTLDGGTLQNTATFTSARAVDLTANGGTLDTAGADLTLSGVIAGHGLLTKEGDGSLILTGFVLPSGISIAQGTVQVGNGGTVGTIGGDDVATSTGTTLAFDRSDPYAFGGVVSGAGALNQMGSGTLVLTGANSYSGNTTISAGVLQVGAGGTSGTLGTGAVIDNAALVFDRSDAPTVANVISGSGSVTQNGGGNLILTGANLYTGPTLINSGTLSVNGSIVSDTTVNNGGTLGGNGTVGNVNVASGGVLAPDNASGTLHVNGNLSFNAGATYRVQVDAAGNADRTDVTGNAALAGTVDVQAGAGSYTANTSYTILTDTGTQSGAFSGVTSNLAFLTPTLSYQPNAVMLNLARNNISFADVVATNNQRGVANALQNAASGATGDIGTVVNAVTNLSADQARAAFDAMGGAGLISLRHANLSFANGFDSQLRARLNVVGAASNAQQTAFNTPVLLAANDHVSDLMPMLAQQSFSLDGGVSSNSADTASSAAPDANRGFWLRGYGSDQSTDGDRNAAGSEQHDVGISVGFDARVNDNLVMGFALTHDRARIDGDAGQDGEANGDSNGNAVALYASYASGPWNVNGVLSYAHSNNSMQRRVVFGGIDRTAASDFNSRTVSLDGDVTYDVPLNGWTLQPLAGLSLSSNRADSFSETGAGALNLQVAGQTVESSKSLLGAKALIDIGKTQLQPRLIWAHEFGDADSASMTTQLQGTPMPFAINGVDVPRDSLIAGLTVSGQASERVSLFADVQEEFNSAQNKLGLLLGLRASW